SQVSGRPDDTVCARAHTPPVRKSVKGRKGADALSVTTDSGVRAQARDAAPRSGQHQIFGGWPPAVAARGMLRGFTGTRTREAWNETESLGEETQGHRPPALTRIRRAERRGRSDDSGAGWIRSGGRPAPGEAGGPATGSRASR